MKTNRILLKGINWVLAGIITILGFAGCDKENNNVDEYGTPRADYTVKGTVVNKTTGKPVKGIRVGYFADGPMPMYGVMPTLYEPKVYVMTDNSGEFEITAGFSPIPDNTPLLIYVNDIDGAENGSFQPENLQLDVSKAEQTKKPDRWHEGEYTLTVKVELTETENQ
ncbi:MAG: radical SAM-associated putative lipoprotein [Cytophagaceae bacterium]|jgi:putative lipoprotein (rSAM/lipoprotein system)|nr:radical SAM-associated putative lipoprotein [Cytophagaceae bacterium]